MKTYHNEEELSTEILKEEVTIAAVPKIVERGTKIPPTYIKPISGGRLSSQFGRRSAPVKGASTYHKGVDWATPIGTTVVASSAGTVIKAGWGSGYGYVVYLKHADGRQTRYAHLSKVLVKVGETVAQGERIALSGNTVDILFTMNARELLHFMKLRTCTRAQWEIRDAAGDMLSGLMESFPALFRHFGPSCAVNGFCPEGRLSCGRLQKTEE